MVAQRNHRWRAKKQIEMCWRAFRTKDARQTKINGEECQTTKFKPMTATTTITTSVRTQDSKEERVAQAKEARKTVTANK